MGISRIGSLFASNADPVVRSQAASQGGAGAQNQPQQTQSAASTDAVVYSRSMSASRTPSAPADDSRAARVQQLKSQVESGAYKADAEKVATAVLKELA